MGWGTKACFLSWELLEEVILWIIIIIIIIVVADSPYFLVTIDEMARKSAARTVSLIRFRDGEESE